jgi:hypothetical protein
MKIGKYIPLGDYKEVKIGYGTVDFKNLKTIYLKLNAWVEPENEELDFDKTISFARKSIKELIRTHDFNGYFKKESIVDLDIRTKGIKMNKRSFMNLEITLFVDNFFDVKSQSIKSILKTFLYSSIEKCLSDKSLFNFSKSKI